MTFNTKILRLLREKKNLFSIALNLVLLFYALLLPFSYAFSAFTGPVLMLLLWMLEGDLENKFQKILRQKAILFLLLFFLLHLLSLLWTDDYHAASRVLKFYLAITIDIIVIYTSLRKGFALPVLMGFLFSMFVSEVLLYGVFFEWWSFKKASVENPSPIMHHVLYSIFLAVTTILLLWQLFDQNISAKIKAFEFFFLTSTTINLFLNGGRTGQLAFLLAIFVFTVTYFGFQKKYLLRTFIGVTILLTLAYQFSPIFHARVHQGLSDIKGIAKGNLNNSWGLRIAMKKVVLEIIKDHPLLGVGVGDVLNEFRHYQKNSDMKQYKFLSTTTHVHDQFLQIVLQTGFIGLVFFILFLYHLFKTDYGDPFTKAIAYSILTIFIFSFFTDVPLRSFTAGLFGFIVGYLLKRGEWATNIKETS